MAGGAAAANGALFTLRLADATTVLAVSADAVLRTQDDGASWQADAPAAGVAGLTGFRSLQRHSASSSIDIYGQAWLSTDGSASWNLRSAGGVAQAGVNSVWFFDSREGLAIADDGSSVRTADGGKTWAAAESDSRSAGTASSSSATPASAG